MESRDSKAADPPHDKPASRQLHVSQDRKPLFSSENGGSREGSSALGIRAKPNLPERSRTTDPAESSRRKPGQEPKGLFHGRRASTALTGTTSSPAQRLSLETAMEMAQREEEREGSEQSFAPDGSPSPAPRTWRSNSTHFARGAPTSPAQDTPSRGARGHLSTRSTSGALDTRDRNQNWRTRNPLTTREPEGQTGEDDVPDGGAIPALVPGIEDLPLPSIESRDTNQSYLAPLAQGSGNVDSLSPSKSNMWDVEQDFTAGDLQMSDSPRIKVGRRPFEGRLTFNENSDIDIHSKNRLNPGSRNFKLDGILAREARERETSQLSRFSPRFSANTKLDDIQRAEERAGSEIPLQSRHLTRLRNTKLKDIEERERNTERPRHNAKDYLGKIRDQNSMSRSLSPDADGSSLVVKATAATPDSKIPVRSRIALDGPGEPISGTPVTIYKEPRNQIGGLNANRLNRAQMDQDKTGPEEAGRHNINTNGSGEKPTDRLLNDLARATSRSHSPAQLPTERPPPTPPKNENKVTNKPAPRLFGRTTNNDRKSLRPGAKDSDKPRSVGFAGLQRERSTESTKSKRSSTHSEMDAVDRIDSEAKLFAPADNYSEKGSVRAPSPEPDEEEEKEDEFAEATPRPKKQDPLTMPTPKVSGAYVDTPVTIRVEDRTKLLGQDKVSGQEAQQPLRQEFLERLNQTAPPKPEPISTKELTKEPEKQAARHRKIGSDAAPSDPRPISTTQPTKEPENPATRHRRTESATASSSSVGEKHETRPRASSAPKPPPRTRPTPRQRPPLRNTARIPSVRDDLRELCDRYNIEDSTLDDFEALRARSKSTIRERRVSLPEETSDKLDLTDDFDLTSELESFVESRIQEPTPEPDKDAFKREESESPGIAQARLMKSLQGARRSTRTAKKGLDRLVNQVWQAENQPAKVMDTPIATKGETAPTTTKEEAVPDLDDIKAKLATHDVFAAPSNLAYVRIPIPRLYQRSPKFHLTLLGWATMLLSLWYVTESTMCAQFCRPEVCSAPPCAWSFDDPTLGVALPVKLDQWFTGGRGRVLLAAWTEQAEDWTADILDAAQGKTLEDYEVNMLSFRQRRQHRRRLRNKGLIKPREIPAEEQGKWDAWRQARLERERARAAKERGHYQYGYSASREDDSFGSDERVW